MPISAIIVDDEQLARDELAYLLRSFPEVEVVAQGRNGVEAVHLVRDHQPALLFLDVQMPGLDGFGVVKRLRERKLPMPQLIFATAYDQYAVQAFEVNAVDYLLKPFDKARLAQALEKAMRHLESPAGSAQKIDRVLELLETRHGPPALAKLPVKANGRHFLLDQNEVIYARIEDGVITVVANQLEGTANCRTIEELQAALDSKLFWRAHRSYLVNLNRIKEVVPWFNSSYQLRMDDKKQTEIPVSRTQSRQLRGLFNL
ncbi:MAG TPA: LytTR family DNA-binding domain-containing protein [Terriglobales bacterium]|nr:LytTR family DNA-binding domain-containing protein [Terriglobales bacterium]